MSYHHYLVREPCYQVNYAHTIALYAQLTKLLCSSQCKHTFSKAAIMGILRQNGNYTSCPIPGCNRGITPQQLVADEVMADRVARARARDEQKANDTQFFEVE